MHQNFPNGFGSQSDFMQQSVDAVVAQMLYPYINSSNSNNVHQYPQQQQQGYLANNSNNSNNNNNNNNINNNNVTNKGMLTPQQQQQRWKHFQTILDELRTDAYSYQYNGYYGYGYQQQQQQQVQQYNNSNNYRAPYQNDPFEIVPKFFKDFKMEVFRIPNKIANIFKIY